MSSLDSKFTGEIFRKDHPMVIASNRHLASILAVKLAYDANGYEAGRVLARNSTSGLYQKYDNGASSGLDTARCVLFSEVAAADFASTGDTQAARAIFGGELFEGKLVGLDSAAKTDLISKSIVDAAGDTILKF